MMLGFQKKLIVALITVGGFFSQGALAADEAVEINWSILEQLEKSAQQNTAALNHKNMPAPQAHSNKASVDLTKPISLTYAAASEQMDDSSRLTLNTVIDGLKNKQRRVDLKAYGGEAGSDAGAARRIALRRGVALRTALIEAGLAPSLVRLTVVGTAAPGEQPHRIDVIAN